MNGFAYLCYLLKEKGINQTQIAVDILGVSKQEVNAWVHERQKIPDRILPVMENVFGAPGFMYTEDTEKPGIKKTISRYAAMFSLDAAEGAQQSGRIKYRKRRNDPDSEKDRNDWQNDEVENLHETVDITLFALKNFMLGKHNSVSSQQYVQTSLLKVKAVNNLIKLYESVNEDDNRFAAIVKVLESMIAAMDGR